MVTRLNIYNWNTKIVLKKKERQKSMEFFSQPYKVLLKKKMSNSHENFGMIIKGNWPSHILSILWNYNN